MFPLFPEAKAIIEGLLSQCEYHFIVKAVWTKLSGDAF
jgi:hypothetical protein